MIVLASGQFTTEPFPPGARVACRVEYDGSTFCGWQSQPGPDVATVQDSLETALADIAQTPIRVHCAGRTDTGVHAHSQIIHFDPPVQRSAKAWVIGTNASLPPAVRVHWATAVPADFHARFTALSRRYRYIIANTPIRSALLTGRTTWYRRPLDEVVMHRAAQSLLGEQDFSAFRAASCQSQSPMRNVQSVSVTRRGQLVVVEIQANAFLHHMVRNIAGALMEVGCGRKPQAWIETLLAGRDRTVAADTAAASGLYLVDVTYPDTFALPHTPEGPAILSGIV